MKKRGYYPRGGGELKVNVPALTKGQTIPPVTLLNRGPVTKINGFSYVSGLTSLTLSRADSVCSVRHFETPHSVRDRGCRVFHPIICKDGQGAKKAALPGSGMLLWAETKNGCIIGGSALGQKNVLATQTGIAAANELLRNLEHGGVWMNIYRFVENSVETLPYGS